MATGPATMYHFNRFILDLARGCLREDDREVRLRRKSFEVLTYFVRNAGRLLSKDELIQAAWPGVYVTEDSLVQCVKEIRRALGEGAQRYLKTVQGRGYLFDAPVSLAEPEAPTPSGLPRAGAWRGRIRAIERRTAAMAAAALVAICGAFGWWLLSSSPAPATREALPAAAARVPVTREASPAAAVPVPGTRDASPAAAAPLPQPSIVVLPFANMLGDPEQEYWADGLTDDLTTELSTHISGLLVIASNSAFTFKGKNASVAQIGRELGARYALEGSVLRTAGRVRVDAQLIDTQAGKHVWAQHFEGERMELFAIEDRITGRIANTMGAELIQAVPRDGEQWQMDADAADLVMRAQGVLFEPESQESLKQAEILVRRALAMYDRNVDAFASLANILTLQVVNFGGVRAADQDERLRQANEAADMALALDPERATAHYAKGFVLSAQRRNLEAAQEYEIAISRDPNYASAYANLGALMFRLGQPERAVPLIERAMRLSPRDPLTGIFAWEMGAAHLFLRHDDLAIEWLLKAQAANPTNKFVLANLAAGYALKGDDEMARVHLVELAKVWPQFSIAVLRANRESDNREYLRLSEETLYTGLRKAGLREE